MEEDQDFATILKAKQEANYSKQRNVVPPALRNMEVAEWYGARPVFIGRGKEYGMVGAKDTSADKIDGTKTEYIKFGDMFINNGFKKAILDSVDAPAADSAIKESDSSDEEEDTRDDERKKYFSQDDEKLLAQLNGSKKEASAAVAKTNNVGAGKTVYPHPKNAEASVTNHRALQTADKKLDEGNKSAEHKTDVYRQPDSLLQMNSSGNHKARTSDRIDPTAKAKAGKASAAVAKTSNTAAGVMERPKKPLINSKKNKQKNAAEAAKNAYANRMTDKLFNHSQGEAANADVRARDAQLKDPKTNYLGDSRKDMKSIELKAGNAKSRAKPN